LFDWFKFPHDTNSNAEEDKVATITFLFKDDTTGLEPDLGVFSLEDKLG
jgi:hypothetical protein